MESAFRLVPALPPAGPGIFAWHHRFRAMRTANARIVLIVEAVVGQLIGLDPHPDHFFRPGCEGRKLHFVVLAVTRDDRGGAARAAQVVMELLSARGKSRE